MFAANAGHNWPYILESGGKIKPIGQDGSLLGREAEVEFPSIIEGEWKKGSQLFLYTDGLIDCYKGDENLYERRHLVRFLKKESKQKGGKLLEKLFDDRDQAIQGLKEADDVTVVVCTRV
jgi:serine phosphatase RsbU (regulator of sigma subunit)